MTLPPDNIAFQALHPSSGEGYMLLLFRPAGGRVAYREWSSDRYTEPGREGTAAVEEVEARVRRWVSEGWKLTQSPESIADWLRSA